MARYRRGAVFVLVSLLLLCVSRPGMAGVPPPEGAADSLAEVAGRRHTARAQDAVVLVRVVVRDPVTGKTEQREGSGFVARCDGFVLLPSELFVSAGRRGGALPHAERFEAGGLTLAFLRPRAGRPIPPQPVAALPFFSSRAGSVLAKVNGWHIPCLQALAPRNVHAGMAVQVVYASIASRAEGGPEADPAKDPDAVRATIIDAVVGAAADKEGKRYTFDPAAKCGLPAVPPGAVVVDRVSGLAVGIVSGSAKRGEAPRPVTSFLTFADLYQVSNAVPLLMDPADRDPVDGKEPLAGSRDGMVWVPGGTVSMAARNDARGDYGYNETYGNRIVCMPGYWIDRTAVTNAEYQSFLQATGYSRLPAGWDVSERRMLLRHTADLPVVGVTLEDAAAYAAWKGARLVAPHEFVRASLGGPDNAERGRAYVRDEHIVLLKIVRACRALSPLARERLDTEIHRCEASPDISPEPIPPPGVTGGLSVPLISVPDILRALVDPFEARYEWPFVVQPVGTRSSDVSRWGVRDIALNPGELLLTNLSLDATEYVPKYPALYNPDDLPAWHDFLLCRLAGNSGVNVGVAVGADGKPVPSRQELESGATLGFTDSAPRDWRIDWWQHSAAKDPIWLTVGMGFRCAR